MLKLSKLYISLTLTVAILNSPLSVLGTFLDLRDLTTYFVLVSWLILDTFFIIAYARLLKFNIFESLLIGSLLISILIGILNVNEISRNLITDITNPLFFLLKAILIRQFLIKNSEFRDFFRTIFVKRLVKYSLLSSVVTIVLYLILSKIKPMYVGLTPLSHPVLIYGFTQGGILYQLAAVLIVLSSGKRALLLSSFVMFLTFKFLIEKRIKPLLYFSILSIIILVGINKLNFNIEEVAALQKYQWTVDQFKDSNVELDFSLDNGLLDIISGGRFTEVNAVLKEMRPLDYYIGKGIGFTYTFSSDTYDYELKNHNNLHFTPLSIITKYGLIFYLILMSYVVFCFRNSNFKDKINIFFVLYLVGSLIDMFFAFTIFVDPILPLAFGYLSAKYNFIKSEN